MAPAIKNRFDWSEMMREERWRNHYLLAGLSLLLLCAGCTGPGAKLSELESDNPVKRMKACAWLGSHQVTEAVPFLIERLNDPDIAVRAIAHRALLDITGEDYNYSPGYEPFEREEVMEKYRKWWQDHKGTNLERGSLRKSGGTDPSEQP